MAIVEEVPGYIQVFSDGTVKRFNPHPVILPGSAAAAAADAAAFEFRDVIIDASKPITARIFVPMELGDGPPSRLPCVVYFHGGGFCFCSTTWSNYHSFLGGLCVRCRCIIFSVDYRLAPENRLPVPYEDCYASLEWLAARSADGGEPWLEKADISRVFLAGESAGGNIVHNVALRLLREPVGGLSVGGLVVIHPFFGSVERTEDEQAEEVKDQLSATDTLWRLSLPEGADRDGQFSNFASAKVSEATWGELPRVLISVAGKDMGAARAANYGAFLKAKGAKEVSTVTAEGEVHAFHVLFPRSEATLLLQSQMAEFIYHH